MQDGNISIYIGAQYNHKRLFLVPLPLDCKSKSVVKAQNGSSGRWGVVIALGNGIELFSVPYPPPCDAFLLSQLGHCGGIDVNIVQSLP
jgi:hypothetical protein